VGIANLDGEVLEEFAITHTREGFQMMKQERDYELRAIRRCP
jgi:hypothetical protein